MSGGRFNWCHISLHWSMRAGSLIVELAMPMRKGYILGLRYNLAATVAWIKACPKGDSKRMKLMGPILFVAKDKEVTDGQTSVRDDQAS